MIFDKQWFSNFALDRVTLSVHDSCTILHVIVFINCLSTLLPDLVTDLVIKLINNKNNNINNSIALVLPLIGIAANRNLRK